MLTILQLYSMLMNTERYAHVYRRSRRGASDEKMHSGVFLRLAGTYFKSKWSTITHCSSGSSLLINCC